LARIHAGYLECALRMLIVGCYVLCALPAPGIFVLNYDQSVQIMNIYV